MLGNRKDCRNYKFKRLKMNINDMPPFSAQLLTLRFLGIPLLSSSLVGESTLFKNLLKSNQTIFIQQSKIFKFLNRELY